MISDPDKRTAFGRKPAPGQAERHYYWLEPYATPTQGVGLLVVTRFGSRPGNTGGLNAIWDIKLDWQSTAEGEQRGMFWQIVEVPDTVTVHQAASEALMYIVTPVLEGVPSPFREYGPREYAWVAAHAVLASALLSGPDGKISSLEHLHWHSTRAAI